MGAHVQESRAVHLLSRVVSTGWFTETEIARELVVSDAALAAYLTGEMPMPLDRQLCLALFVIDHVPPFARLGHRLRGQVTAAMAYHAGVTTTHADCPPGGVWR